MMAHDVSGNYPDKEYGKSETISVDQFVAAMTRLAQCQQHTHQWAVLEVQEANPGQIHPRLAQQPRTLVLLRCHRCELPTSLVLEGAWSMTQIMQQIGEQVASQARSTTSPSTDTECYDDQPSGEYPPG